MSIKDILKTIVNEEASDIFIVAGRSLTYKVHGHLRSYNNDSDILKPQDCFSLISEIYELAGNRGLKNLESTGDDDFSFTLPDAARFRVNAFKQRGSLSAVIRVIAFDNLHPEKLKIPNEIIDFPLKHKKGLVLITGPAGSGKSTTLACMIDKINNEREAHIITLEDPIEYLHYHKKSIVSQREIISDTESYLTALRASLRESPDVILLGEMRDPETISVAMTAAETGHLVLSTLHTIGAANTIERIIDAFPPNQQHQIYIQLSMVLQMVVSQQLVDTTEGKRVPAFEIMKLNPAIRNNIRERNLQSIENFIATGEKEGMILMNRSLANLVKNGIITEETAYSSTTNPENLERELYFLNK
ncbi:MAG: PilT/PilU family type 4a pilus ATPase [Lachnospiraceae bacterium]|nr:PilT/PilU family type 4a pilus ATPase [Lachnospiraceae bacterium]